LKNFDFSSLNGELTIGTNRAFERHECSVNVFMDTTLFGHYECGRMDNKRWLEYKGIRLFWSTGHYLFPPRDDAHPYDIYTVEPAGLLEFPTDSLQSLSAANNSGFLALNLAAALGANPIYLLGYDMHGKAGKKTWWHDGYPHDTQSTSIYASFIETFDLITPRLDRLGIEVINLTPRSALHTFPTDKITNVLKTSIYPRFISFYTKNTPYEQEIKRLEASLIRHGLPYDFTAVNSTGSWVKNTHMKPRIIHDALLAHPNEDIVWVDSDAVIHKAPTFLNQITADIGVPSVLWSKHPCKRNDREILSGTIFFKNNNKTLAFTDHWSHIMEEKPQWVDQQSFRKALHDMKDMITTVYLPETYCQIFDTMASSGDPVIEHYQASRRFRNEITK